MDSIITYTGTSCIFVNKRWSLKLFLVEQHLAQTRGTTASRNQQSRRSVKCKITDCNIVIVVVRWCITWEGIDQFFFRAMRIMIHCGVQTKKKKEVAVFHAVLVVIVVVHHQQQHRQKQRKFWKIVVF